MTIHLKTYYPRLTRERWRDCRMCGPKYKRVELMFDAGSVEPATDEVLTGGTSGHYGTVVSVELESGTWAGGDADGRVELKDVSGLNEDGEIFTDGETITGSAGATLVADDVGWEQVYGILHPEGNMVFAEDGYWYCKQHYLWRFAGKHLDEARVDVNERERNVK